MAAPVRVLPLVVIAAALLVDTQAVGSGAPARDASTRAAGGDGSHLIAAKRRHRRPGCGRFCRQAGSFGPCAVRPDGTSICTRTHHPVRIRSQTVRVDRFGTIGIRATCRRKRKCLGAILVHGHVSYGRADLRIPGHKTRVVKVAVPPKGIRYLKHHRRDRKVFAFVPLNESDAFSNSRRLTLLAPHERED